MRKVNISSLNKKKLAHEFKNASKDKSRNAELSIWDSLNGDGLDEKNEFIQNQLSENNAQVG